MPLYLTVTPEHLTTALALTPHLAHAAYGVSGDGTLLSRNLPATLRGGVMVVDCGTSFPAVSAEALAREVISQCLQRSFSGIVLDAPPETSDAASALARRLQPLCALYRRRLFLPPHCANAAPEATILLCTALSGGSLPQRLQEACAQYGAERIALDLQRLMMEFPLPCPTGEGTPLTSGELQQRQQSAAIYYCSELCARYFTRRHGSSTRFILFDDADTLRRKWELAQTLGISDAFVMWPEAEDLLSQLFGTKKEGEP